MSSGMRMHRLLPVLASLSVLGSALQAQGAPACSSDAVERDALKKWVEVWTMAPASDTLNSETRALYHLPTVTSASNVKVVTTTNTCKQLRTALAVTLGSTVPATSLSVVVVQVDTVYVAYDKAQKAGEFILVGVYGKTYKELTRFFF